MADKFNSCRTFPGWIRLALIRRVDDVAAIGIDDKNHPDRFENAFQGVPRQVWHVFSNPYECARIIEHTVSSDP